MSSLRDIRQNALPEKTDITNDSNISRKIDDIMSMLDTMNRRLDVMGRQVDVITATILTRQDRDMIASAPPLRTDLITPQLYPRKQI